MPNTLFLFSIINFNYWQKAGRILCFCGMELFNINPSVTVKLPTLVWIHICPQACRHGVTRLVWGGHVQAVCSRCGFEPQTIQPLCSRCDVPLGVFCLTEVTVPSFCLGGGFSRHFLPDSCCTFLHLLDRFSFHLDQCSLCKDMNKMAASRPFLQFRCRKKKKKRHWIYCMIECKNKKYYIVVYFICLIDDICMLHDFKIKVIL